MARTSFLPCLKLEKKWREGSHWRKRYEPPKTAYHRLCAPVGMLSLKARAERYETAVTRVWIRLP